MRSAGILALGLFVLAVAGRAPTDDFKPEEGFALLFNGKDLSGWKLKKGDALDGKTEAAEKRFVVKDGLLVIDEKVKGDVVLYTVKEFGKDVVLRFDFRPGKGCNNDVLFRGFKVDL